MSKLKSWLVQFMNGVLQNILASILLVISVPVLAGLYAFYTTNPPTALLWVLVVFATFSTVINIFLIRQQLNIVKSSQEIAASVEKLYASNQDIAAQQQLIRVSLQEVYGFLEKLPSTTPTTPTPYVVEDTRDPLTRQVDAEFEITDKHFIDTTTPQKIVVQFTNRGSNIIHVKKVKWSDHGLGLPSSAISPAYRKEGRHSFIIPVDLNIAEVAPGQNFPIEVCLGQTWKREDINRIAGQWGYLRIEVDYSNQPVELFTSI